MRFFHFNEIVDALSRKKEEEIDDAFKILVTYIIVDIAFASTISNRALKFIIAMDFLPRQLQSSRNILLATAGSISIRLLDLPIAKYHSSEYDGQVGTFCFCYLYNRSPLKLIPTSAPSSLILAVWRRSH